ncbi:DUF559 domain-containing protein [Candidatus Uhrbacteria bacterium]|nr:DUF559 domain-containing protein [Candidatus Uhrbacteria bacterium]
MSGNHIVLVGVLKGLRDLELLRKERWYRIPAAAAPTRPYTYLAFYQPAAFGVRGKSIRYYARVLSRHTVPRRRLLPDESEHPRASEQYIQLRIGALHTLRRPIRNIVPRRVTFGFTTLHRLRTARDLLQLYQVAPIEQMVEDGLRRAGIRAIAQRVVVSGGRRCRLDFAIPCTHGAIAVECDNRSSHQSPQQRARDRNKDAFLRSLGWTVVRLPERDIVGDLSRCIARVRAAIRACGG